MKNFVDCINKGCTPDVCDGMECKNINFPLLYINGHLTDLKRVRLEYPGNEILPYINIISIFYSCLNKKNGIF